MVMVMAEDDGCVLSAQSQNKVCKKGSALGLDKWLQSKAFSLVSTTQQ